jgi:spermidine synthase
MVGFIPEGEKGEAQVKHVQVGKQDASFTMIRAMATGDAGRVVREGAYAQLFVNGCLVMSDTQMERRSNYGVVWNATGDVLIAGLGLGMILLPILYDSKVKTVTVIELSQDVIDLVEPHVRKAMSKKNGAKLTVICADIYEWKPPKGVKWDCIYFDIWADICTDNLKDMSKLHRKFARRKKPGAWMNSWQREMLKSRHARDRREERAMGRFW